MSASVSHEELKAFLSADLPWPVAPLIVCKELLQLWEQPEQLSNDHPAEHVAALGMWYELPSVAINILDIKYSKPHDAQTTPTASSCMLLLLSAQKDGDNSVRNISYS